MTGNGDDRERRVPYLHLRLRLRLRLPKPVFLCTVKQLPAAPPQPKATSTPTSVLTPPTVDLRSLRAIRLDWDELGITQ
jgi:hypothetical protein